MTASFAEQLQAFWPKLKAKIRHPRGISARLGIAFDETKRNRVIRGSKNKGYLRGRRLGGLRRVHPVGKDKVHPVLDQFSDGSRQG